MRNAARVWRARLNYDKMTSAKAGLPLELGFGQAKGIHSKIGQSGQKDYARHAGQARRRAGGQPSQFK